MASRLFHVFLILSFVSLQLVWALWLPLAMPELVFAVIIALALSDDFRHSLWWVGLGGLLLDLVIGSFAGLHLVLFSVLCLFLTLLARQVLHRPSLAIASIIFILASFLFEISFALFNSGLHISIVVPTVITASFATFFYWSILAWSQRKEVIQFG